MEQRKIQTPDGINWHVQSAPGSTSTERREYVVLIPSGEGDCHSLETAALLLASQYNFSVLTFDLPGFSRTTGPQETYTRVTAQLYAKVIITLLDGLKIDRASFWGSSSGGAAALALAALYPERVKCSVVHEVPLGRPEFLVQLAQQPDDVVSNTCQQIFATVFIEQDENDGPQKWAGLGREYHERLAKNYVTWIRGFMDCFVQELLDLATPENLQKRPIFWTVGALNKDLETGRKEFDVAEAAGIKVDIHALRSLHFPSVTVPEQLAQWISRCIQSVQS